VLRYVRARSKRAIWSVSPRSAVGSPGAPPLSGGSGFLNRGGLAGFLHDFFRGFLGSFLASLLSSLLGCFFCGGFLGGGLADALRAAFLGGRQGAGAQGLLGFLRRGAGIHELGGELPGHLVGLLDDTAPVVLLAVGDGADPPPI